jgi:hypothetical protein
MPVLFRSPSKLSTALVDLIPDLTDTGARMIEPTSLAAEITDASSDSENRGRWATVEGSHGFLV